MGDQIGVWEKSTARLLLLLILLVSVGRPTWQRNGNAQAYASSPRGGSKATQQVGIAEIATSPDLPGIIVASLKTTGDWLPIQYSTDAGMTWRHVDKVPYDENAVQLRIAIAPRSDQSARLLVMVHGGGKAGLYRSGDFGMAWLKQSLPVNAMYYDALAVSPAKSADIFLAVSETLSAFPPVDAGHALVSDDAGESWSRIDYSPANWFTEICPSPIMNGRAYYAENLGGWLQIDDLGGTLSQRSFPTSELALDAIDSELLYGVGTRSIDGGETWTPWPDPPSGCQQVLPHPTKARVVFARCAKGLVRSENAADTWEQISTLPGDLLAPDYGVPGRILWAKGNEIWATTNDGADWTKLTALRWRQSYLPMVRK